MQPLFLSPTQRRHVPSDSQHWAAIVLYWPLPTVVCAGSRTHTNSSVPVALPRRTLTASCEGEGEGGEGEGGEGEGGKGEGGGEGGGATAEEPMTMLIF